MEYVGIDLHKKESQICLLTETGEVIERRIRTEPQRFAEVLGGRPRARILVEASTESEWVARCLEALGHEVVVADPNFAPMYATRSRCGPGRPASPRAAGRRSPSSRCPPPGRHPQRDAARRHDVCPGRRVAPRGRGGRSSLRGGA